MRHQPLTRALTWIGLVVGALVLLASCGDDSDTTPVPVSTTVDEPAPSADDEPEPPPEPPADDPSDDPGEDRSAELAGNWEIVNYTLSDGGALTNIVGTETPFIEFHADGSLTFHTGCNAGNATWETSGGYVVPTGLDNTPEGQPIQIRNIVSDQAVCDGFLGEQDADLIANLEKASRFIVKSDGGVNLLDEFILVVTQAGA